MTTNDRTWHVDFNPKSQSELDAKYAVRAEPPSLRRRKITVQRQSYTVYSADELLELDSLAHHGRPGHLHG